MRSRPATLLRIAAEFAVIVAGVSVGLLADDWRQDREAEAEERRFLEDVLVDLLADSAEMELVRSRFVDWDEGALALFGANSELRFRESIATNAELRRRIESGLEGS